MIDPSSHAVEARHHRRNDRPRHFADQKEFRLHLQLALDHDVWGVPGRIVREHPNPQPLQCRSVRALERSNREQLCGRHHVAITSAHAQPTRDIVTIVECSALLAGQGVITRCWPFLLVIVMPVVFVISAVPFWLAMICTPDCVVSSARNMPEPLSPAPSLTLMIPF